MLTCSLTWQTDCCTAWRKCQGFPSQALLKPSMRLLFDKLPEWAPSTTWLCRLHNYMYGTLVIRLCSIKSSLPSFYPVRHLRFKLFQAFSRFSVLQVMKSWAGPGNEPSYTPMKPFNSQILCRLQSLSTFIANNKGQGSNLLVNKQGYDQLCRRLLAV